MKKQIIKIVLLGFVIFSFYGIAHADTTIHLDIESASGSIYNQDISVTPCNSDHGATTSVSVSAYCAVLQSGVTSDWSWFGTDAFLNSINGLANDFGNNIYWGWFGDLIYGATSLSAHTLTSGEQILINYNINPLQLVVSNPNPMQHESVTLTLNQFGLDSNFNPIWTPATSGSITINGTSHTVGGDGTYLLRLDSSSPYTIRGSETGFLNSNTTTLNPSPSATGSLAAPTPGHSNTEAIDAQIKPAFDLKNAFQFLSGQQKSDGSFGSDLYTDWSAIALASGNNQDQVLKLIKYLGDSKIDGTFLTDYERRAMALMALGLNPYDTNGENYIGKIVGGFDGKQFGAVNQDNDDIFALIVLQNAGYTEKDEIVAAGINFILGAQKNDGSWDGSADMTGAAIEALAVFSDNAQVKNALIKAENFLELSQKNNGSWGNNVSSTAWAIEGILAQGEQPKNWVNGGNSPLDYLSTMQDKDGGIKDVDMNTKIWETAYATSAFSGKNWNQIMQKFDKSSSQVPEQIAKEATPLKQSEKSAEIKKSEIKKSDSAVNVPASLPAETKPAPKERGWFTRILGYIFGF